MKRFTAEEFRERQNNAFTTFGSFTELQDHFNAMTGCERTASTIAMMYTYNTVMEILAKQVEQGNVN